MRTEVMSSGVRFKVRPYTRRIILHDSHTEVAAKRIEDVTRWEWAAKENGLRMGLISIGYHFIVERGGHGIVETRDRHLVGTHTPGHNMDSIGICLVGGREAGMAGVGIDNFTKTQIEDLFLLYDELFEEYGELEIKGHSEVQKYRNRALPDCPPIDMDEHRQDYALWRHNRDVYRRLKDDG